MSDSSALAAVLDKSLAFDVRPVHPWRQPKEIIAEEQPPIQRLNEDCLIALFKLTDSRSKVALAHTCKLFKSVLDRNFFPRINSLVISAKMTREDVEKALSCVGAHIQILEFKSLFNEDIRLLNKYVGESIRELHLHGCYGDPVNTIQIITPILLRLHVLTLTSCEAVDLSLLEKCTNLKKLKIHGKIHWNRKQSLAIPNLQHLKFDSNLVFPSNRAATFESIIVQNRQLKCVKTRDVHITIANIENIPNVEKLTICCLDRAISISERITYLSTLENLTKLTLFQIYNRNLNLIFDRLKQLKSLVTLKIYVGAFYIDHTTIYHSYQIPLVTIAGELTNLEKFLLDGLTLEKPTIFDIVRNATKLQSFHIHRCKMLVSNVDLVQIHPEALVTEIVRARKSMRIEGRSKPLKLFVDPDVYNGLDGISIENNEFYMKISGNCNHTKRSPVRPPRNEFHIDSDHESDDGIQENAKTYVEEEIFYEK